MPRTSKLEKDIIAPVLALAQSNQNQIAMMNGIEIFKSNPLSYIDGIQISFAHGWANFDPALDWYQVQTFAVCTTAEKGWQVGDRPIVVRGVTTFVTATEIILLIGSTNKVRLGRKTGSLNETGLTSSSWQLAVKAFRSKT